VEIADGEVSYLDLIVDVVVSPTGEVSIEDEDELRTAARKGRLDEQRLQAIERALSTITRDWRRIVREALAALPEDVATG
jgi:predicted RNA-binding protein associated with RNAse of E/G family